MSLTPRSDKLEQAVYGDEIEVSKIDAPDTTIVDDQGNPRQIDDLTNNMKVSMGSERILFQGISKLNKEFGPEGQPVWELSNKDDRVRHVGSGWFTASETNGTRVYSKTNNTTDHKIEVTFYGTGLNLIVFNGNVDRPYNLTVDGVVKPVAIFPESSILTNRKYGMNSVFQLVSGLDLDVHTVVLSQTGTDAWMDTFGCEILNESTQLTINPGKTRYYDRETLTQTLSSYNSDFDDASDTLGTKGGRVLVYQAIDGSINKRFKATDPAVTEGDPTELITNGTFDTDLSSWATEGTATWVSGEADVRHGGTTGKITQTITTVIGQKYQVKVDVTQETSASGFGLGLYIYEVGTTNVIEQLYIDVIGSKFLTFTATNTSTDIAMRSNTSSSGTNGGGRFDNMSVKEVAYNFLALGDTDHSNEEVARTYNFREFNCGRTDDFGIPALGAVTKDAAYTLDDGTTTLVGDQIQATLVASQAVVGIVIGTNGTLTMTFVGTGLDIVAHTSAGFTTVDQHDFIIDGINVGNLAATDYGFTSAFNSRRIKVCSGLPYGTHTVRFGRTTIVGSGLWTSDFITYEPKKPELESTDIELSEYNILADYSSYVWAESADMISQGVLRKQNTREVSYYGTFNFNENAANLDVSGKDVYSNGAAGTGTYFTFFGTGVVLRWRATTSRTICTVSIDGNTNSSALNTEFIAGVAGTSFVPATGYLDQSVTAGADKGCGLVIKDLPLGLHTIELTNISVGQMVVGSFDVITPIHSNNTKLGSLALKDLRKTIGVGGEIENKIDLSKAKAWCKFDMLSNTILSSYNISAAISTGTGTAMMYFKRPFKEEHYVVAGTVYDYPVETYSFIFQVRKQFASSFQASCWYSNNGASFNGTVLFVCYGELENEEDIDLGDL